MADSSRRMPGRRLLNRRMARNAHQECTFYPQASFSAPVGPRNRRKAWDSQHRFAAPRFSEIPLKSLCIISRLPWRNASRVKPASNRRVNRLIIKKRLILGHLHTSDCIIECKQCRITCSRRDSAREKNSHRTRAAVWPLKEFRTRARPLRNPAGISTGQ